MNNARAVWMLGAFLGLASSFVPVAKGQEWTRFRGPNGQGISEATGLPVKWTESDHNWKIELPGVGHSSPVIWGDKVFITCGDQKTGHGALVALHVADGRQLWREDHVMSKYRMNVLNTYATATPALDADHVYTLWPAADEIVLAATDHDGGGLWRRTFGGHQSQHGSGTSPIVVGDIVVFTCEHEDSTNKEAKSFWIAVDRMTGQTRWELPRQTGPKTSYSTPCVYSPAGGAVQLVFESQRHGMTGVDPLTGKVLWEVESAFPSRVVSSPVIAGGLLIGSCGDGSSGKRLIAIRPGAEGKPEEVYKVEDGAPYVPTSIAVGGLLFTFHDRGYVSCHRSDTGKRLWREKPAKRFFSSPVSVEGRLYCITPDGDVVVIKAAETYELLATNPLGEKSQATPAVAEGRLYLRTYSHLISIGPKSNR